MTEMCQDKYDGPSRQMTDQELAARKQAVGPDRMRQPREKPEGLTSVHAEIGLATTSATAAGNWLGAREQLTHAIADLTREAERGMTAAELAADLAALRDSLPAVLSPAADRALARLVSDASHVRRGLR